MNSIDVNNNAHLTSDADSKPSFFPTNTSQTESNHICTTKSVHTLQETAQDYGATPRKKRTDKAQQAENRKRILDLIEKGHPTKFIALTLKISEAIVTNTLVKEYILKKVPLPIPHYQILKAGCSFKDLGEHLHDAKYIKVTQNETSFNITPFEITKD